MPVSRPAPGRPPPPSSHFPASPAYRTALAALTFLAALALPAAPVALEAQTPNREPAVVELPAGARAAGLGHAYPLGHPDADVLFANPALLGATGGMTLGVHLLSPSVLAVEAAAATAWYGGAVGVGVRALHHPTPGPGRRSGGLEGLVGGGADDVSELLAAVGYARTVAGFQVGAASKLVAQRFSDQSETGMAVDLGIARELGGIAVGVALRDLGPDRTYGAAGSDRHVSQPTSVTLGASGYGRPVGPLDLGASAAVGRRHDGELLAGGGIELGYWPVVGRTFVARAGVRRVPDPGGVSPFTFGGAFWGDALRLEYAWQPLDGRDDVHRVSVGWR